jgi:hypothetical protein
MILMVILHNASQNFKFSIIILKVIFLRRVFIPYLISSFKTDGLAILIVWTGHSPRRQDKDDISLDE